MYGKKYDIATMDEVRPPGPALRLPKKAPGKAGPRRTRIGRRMTTMRVLYGSLWRRQATAPSEMSSVSRMSR